MEERLVVSGFCEFVIARKVSGTSVSSLVPIAVKQDVAREDRRVSLHLHVRRP